MAQAITLARPYARAAFEVAQAAGAMDAWLQALAFAAAVAADPRVGGLGADPRVLPAQLVALHLPPGVAQEAPFARFLGELAEQGRMALLPEVVNDASRNVLSPQPVMTCISTLVKLFQLATCDDAT